MVWLLSMAAFGPACSDVDFYYPAVLPPAPLEVKPNSIQGSFCTEDPKSLVFPLKVWAVIDDSGSMQQSDPNQRRYTGVQQLATSLSAPGKVFFGGQVFSGDTTRTFTSPRFTDVVEAFNAQVQAVLNPGDGRTPYLAALNLAISELSADVAENAVIAKRTRYVVVFLSDGVPTDSQEPEITGAMTRLMLLKGQVGGLTVNTVFLGGADANAEAVLQKMAMVGEGVYKSFPNGDALDYTGFDFSSIQRSYVQRFFAVTNRTMLATSRQPCLDSDADSLCDVDEVKRGTKPDAKDTDGDGCNDAFEVQVGWDPLSSMNNQCTCQGLTATQDSDLDGLTDCEEKWMGSNSLHPDSDLARDGTIDGDLIPDGLDFFLLGDVGLPNTNADKDSDSVGDLEEFKTHTDVNSIDQERSKWAYQYTKFSPSGPTSRCTEFVVDNILLGETLASREHAANENIIELFFAQSSQDDPYRDRFYRLARLKVPYAEGGRVITVTPEDFIIVLQPPPAN